MPKPVSAQQAVLLANQIKSNALTAILKSGAQRGQVVSQQGSKTILNFSGKRISVDLKALNLKPGQLVNARMEGGRILIQPQARQSQPSTNTSQANPNSISNALSQMGLKGAQFETLANALVQAGIPLDKTALKQLAQFLPQANPDQMAALQFLFARGLPVSPSLVSLLSQILNQRRKPSEHLDKLLQQLDDLDHDLDALDEDIVEELRKRFQDHRENLQQQLRQNHPGQAEQNKDDFTRQIQKALQSLEALLQEQDKKSVERIIRHLLQDIRWALSQTTDPKLTSKLEALLHSVEQIQQAQSSSHLGNIPSHADTSPTLFMQLPYQENGHSKEMELRYKKESDDHSQGTLDLRLEFSNLGPVHINMLWQKPALTITFHVERESIKDWLEPHLQTLEAALQNKGLTPSGITIKVAEIPATLQPDTPHTTPTTSSGFDIQA